MTSRLAPQYQYRTKSIYHDGSLFVKVFFSNPQQGRPKVYSQINTAEIKSLAEKKAGGLATQIYLVLSAHCWKTNSCFPSISRISDMLGGAYHINSIHRALKWLEDNGFISRQAVRSSSRFVMKVRELTKMLGASPKQGHKRKSKRKNNYRYSNSVQKHKKPRFQDETKPSKQDWIGDWVDRAMAYILGETNTAPKKASREKVREWMLGGQNAASIFWPDISSKLSHLLV